MPDEQANPDLIKYILECRARGFEDWQIRSTLDYHGWKEEDIEAGFEALKKEEEKKLKKKEKRNNKIIYVYKNTITIHLSEDIYNAVAKRAKRNMLSVEEQVEDIVRRSCVSLKKKEIVDNVDDIFLKLFSRKNVGKKK